MKKCNKCGNIKSLEQFNNCKKKQRWFKIYL